MGRITGVLSAAALALTLSTAAQAEFRTTFAELGPGTQALIYQPATPGPKARVGLVVIHPYAGYMSHSACGNMADRGYTVICTNTRFTNNQYGYTGFDEHAPAIRASIERLRKIPGVAKIVIVGHSAGAPMMAFYQNVAQNGAGVCQGPEKLLPCNAENLKDLPAADGIVLMDPHLGDAFATLTYVDPAVADESHPANRDKSLDMFDAANGYDLDKRRGSYGPAFRKTFLAAQADRNARLIAHATEALTTLRQKGSGLFGDDMPFVAPGATAARLWQPDTALLKRTQKPHKLLAADGSQPVQILTSVRMPSGNPREAQGFGSILEVSVKGFLGAHAIRTTADYNQTEDDVTGVDWTSSATSTLPNMKGVTVPLLVEVMTGHYFLRPGEMVLDAAGGTDKDMVGIEGATHGITPCAPCGPTPTHFGDTVKRTYDYMDLWLAARFLAP